VTIEPFRYRAWKWAVQRVSGLRSRADQHDRLKDLDWDIVVVLDACRWDTLEAVADWPMDYCHTPGTTTREWLTAAGESGVFEDTHVVSANVNYERHDDLGERTLEKLWETDWDGRLGNVAPEPVLDRADEALDAADAPVVAHVVPPHAPYIAKVGEEWLPVFPGVQSWKNSPGGDTIDQYSQQEAMAGGLVDLDRAARGYRASVESVWSVTADYVGRWVKAGNTVVVTADHGETFGGLEDYFLVEHPHSCYVSPLDRVPFEVFEWGSTPGAAETTEEKLAALGYVE
jgi:hypothetical protein